MRRDKYQMRGGGERGLMKGQVDGEQKWREG